MKGPFVKGAGILLLAGLTGCVSQGTHDQTLRELQSAKSDLDRIRVQNESLNKQVAGLKESNARLKEEQDKATLQIASLKEEIVKERQAGDARSKDLERQVKELVKAKKDLAQDLEVQKQRYEDSLRIQKRQAKELKEREPAALLQPPTPPTASSPAATAPPSPPPDQAALAPPPAPKPVLVDINKATPAELTLALELPKEDADKLVKNRPYKTKEELVTKAGIAKATVDRIRDKIAVGP